MLFGPQTSFLLLGLNWGGVLFSTLRDHVRHHVESFGFLLLSTHCSELVLILLMLHDRLQCCVMTMKGLEDSCLSLYCWLFNDKES